MNIQNQRGIGLIEVMVALLLLAIAVLGFSALQMRAVGATDESLVRTHGTSIVRALSESMRNNVEYLPDMAKVIDGTTTTVPDCVASTCNKQQMAQYTAKELKDRAETEGFSVSMVDCPGVADRTISVAGSTATAPNLYCAIVAWGSTKAELGTGTDVCADTDGTYRRGSTCLIMETY